MRVIIKESYQDVENYLRSPALVREIVNRYGEYYYHESSKGSVSEFVIDKIVERFDDKSINGLIHLARVVVCKVFDQDEIDLVDTDRYVVEYNGYYYDYTAQDLNDQFESQISPSSIPIVQEVIYSSGQVSSTLSTIRNYVILGY